MSLASPIGIRMRFAAGVITVASVTIALTALAQTPAAPAVSKNPVEHGAALFHVSGCEHCHGSDGRGTELGPDLGTVGKRLDKAKIEHQIHEGGGGMPSFAEALQPDEISALVAYLATKKKIAKGDKPYQPWVTAVAPAP